MKTMFKSFALIAIAALSLAACSKKEAPINDENEMITLKFNIKNADEAATRALIGTDENGKKFLNWEDGDQIGTFSAGSFVSGSSSYSVSNNNPGTVEVSNDSFTLNVQAFYTGTITNIYSYFPYSAAAGKDKTAAIVSIPANQFVNSEGFDADAMPMAGIPVEVDLSIAEANKDKPCGDINFLNLGSIINFKIYSGAETDETLTSVKFVSTSGNLGGNFTIDLTAIDASNESTLALKGDGSANEITTSLRAPSAIGTGKSNAIDVYMVVAPGTYSGTQVVVTTSAKTYTLNASGEKTFTRSSVKPMYVDIKKGIEGDLPQEETWVKVTKASDFTAGTYYILRADGKYYVPNDRTGSNHPACVAYTEGDAITSSMRWVATKSGNGLVFESFSATGNYLYTTNTGSPNTICVVESSTGANASNVWSFASVTSDNVTYYTATAGANKYLVSYGTSNWRYYGSSSISETNIPAEFYKLSDGTTPVTTTYAITFDDEIENGEVTASKTTEIEEGESITLTITPDEGFELETLIVNDSNVTSSVSAGKYTFVMPANDVAVSATFKAAQTSTNDGTLEHPYTASEARALALAGDEGSYYISGIVTKVQNQYSASYGTANFWIDENGTSQSVFEGYKIKYFGEVNWVDGNAEIAVNDKVIIYGTLTVYTNGSNKTPETSSGYLVSLNGKTKGLTPRALTATPDNDNKQITVTWGAATGTDSAISYAVSCGEQTYNATAAGSYTFTMANYGTYTVSLVASAEDAVSASLSTSATLSDPGSTAPDPVTMNIFSNEATVTGSGEGQTATWTSGDITVTAVKTSSTATAFRNSDTDHTRFYTGWTITVSSAANTISSVEFTCTSNAYATTLANHDFSKGTASASGALVLVSGVSDSETSTTLTGQVRVSSITVTYE